MQALVDFRRHSISAGAFERQCYRYAAGTDAPSAMLLIDLLRSADGERVLDHLMRGSKAAWWDDLARDRRQAASARQHHEQFQLL